MDVYDLTFIQSLSRYVVGSSCCMYSVIMSYLLSLYFFYLRGE